jgi:GDP-mannose 6-dehydrogenase
VIDKNSEYRIHIIGLGPVGLATAWELLKKKYYIHGYEISESRLQNILKNKFEVDETMTEDLINFTQAGQFKLNTGSKYISGGAKNYFIICVGTPTLAAGADTSYVLKAIDAVNTSELMNKHIIIRSTLQPGTIQKIILNHVPETTLFSYHPEFLREKYIKDDIDNPPLRIAVHKNITAMNSFSFLYKNMNHYMNIFTEAETLKVMCNAFHAMKVTFSNEVLRLADKIKFDSVQVMDLFSQDIKLNISSQYLKPGLPFGGNCLDKDLNALRYQLSALDIKLPLLESIQESNELHKIFIGKNK